MCIFEQQFTQCNCRIISSDRNSFMYYFSINHNKRGKVSRKVKQRSYFLSKTWDIGERKCPSQNLKSIPSFPLAEIVFTILIG